MIKKHKSYLYAKGVVENKIPAPKYVKIQCQEFKDIAEGKSDKNVIDTNMVKKIDGLLKLMNMADGLKAGKTVYESLAGFQWLFIIAILTVKHKEDIEKRRYELATMLIGRKSGKTFIIAVIFALLLLLEPEFSQFYSVAADGELSRLVKTELEKLLSVSPLLKNRFIVRRTDVTCKLTNNVYKPLNYSRNRMDGRMASVWLADEVGALPETYAIDAMKSSQINMKNRLGIMISTAYPNVENPMIEEIGYAKQVLDGTIENESYFALIYEPDDKENWRTNDEMIYQSNPLALEIEENLQYLYEQREDAINKPSSRGNFLTKHLNIFIQSNEMNEYLDIDEFKKGKVKKIDLEGKEVVVGVDLAISTDLTAVSILYKENGKYFIYSKGFLPKNTLDDREEKIDYKLYEDMGYCELHDGLTINYTKIEQYIRSIEERHKCRIKCIVSDKYNALQMMESLSNDYEVILLSPTYTVLSPPLKSFRDEVYNGNVFYKENKLFEWCVANAIEKKGTYDDILIAKERQHEKIDLLDATIFAYSQLYLIDDEVDINEVTDEYLDMMGW